jgi:zinc finger FYVE domain-containing protein 26
MYLIFHCDLQVHFFLKRRVGTLSEEEHARLDRLALGLRMLGTLPLPWQQRCSALHEHPRLILETLLMGKQLRAASQVLSICISFMYILT